LISEEVEPLIPILRAERKQKVHLISYAAPVTKNMVQFNKLSYYVLPPLPNSYAIPTWLSIELGIFAGRLYLDFPEYATMMEHLGITDQPSTEDSVSKNDQVCPFVEHPSHFLLEWLSLRRKGQDVMHTPMGYICQGRALHEGHPFFAAPRVLDEPPAYFGVRNKDASEDDDDDDDEDDDDDNDDDNEDEDEDNIDDNDEDNDYLHADMGSAVENEDMNNKDAED
jgi:hypothetical protein